MQRRRLPSHGPTRLLATAIAALLSLSRPCHSFSPLVPTISHATHVRASPLGAALQVGERVLLIGGTSGVGQLVSRQLLARTAGSYRVRVAARTVDAAAANNNNSALEFTPLHLVSTDPQSLARQLDDAMQDVAAVVITVGTTAFPTIKWRNGNTPAAIDRTAVRSIAEAAGRAAGTGTLKRVILLSSIGVDRSKEVPFVFLNLFGVLDAKRDGANAVKESATKHGFDYVIVRAGRLIGGTPNKLDVVADLLNAQGGVELARGDTLLGDCKRDACAEAIVQALRSDACSNLDFSIISTDEQALTDEQWEETFRKLNE